MKCIYIIYCVLVTVISAAIPKDLCDTCVPTQDCPLFKNLNSIDQLIWMEKFPCGSVTKNKNYEVPAGFASAAKGDYVCCSNNIWGLESPEFMRPHIGHQSWNNLPPNRPYNYPYDNHTPAIRPGNNNNYYFNNNNPTDQHLSYEPHANIDHETYNNGTIWFPNRTQNYDNADYWLTHSPENVNSNNNSNYWNYRPSQNWNTRSTHKPITSDNTEFFSTPYTYYFTGTTANPYFTDNNPREIERIPVRNDPPKIIVGRTPPVNIQNIPPRNVVNVPNQYDPPENTSELPIQDKPSSNIVRPPIQNEPPRYISRHPMQYYPPQYLAYPPYVDRTPRNNYFMPRPPYINNFPRPRSSIYDDGMRRNDKDYLNNNLYTQPFDGNFGGGQCDRLTSFPPDPKSDCCGRQLADDDRITGQYPVYNRPAFTNHWQSPPFRSGPIWRTRRAIYDNKTDDDVTIERRISGGQATELYQYPWTVLLLTTFDYGRRESSFNCGGSLISAKYVLTAGHCVYDKGAAVKSVQINLAEYDKRTFPKDCKTTGNGRRCIENIVMYAEEIITHPQYENENLVNDISLIRIRGTAPYTEYIRPICLPSINIDEPQFSNLQFEVAGWGRNGPYSSDIKQSTFLHLVNHNQCRRYYPQLTNKHLCAAGQRGADTCKGDSGGPLMILYRGRYYVAGIVSGKRADSPCGTAVPSLYTNVYHYVDWIRRNIRN